MQITGNPSVNCMHGYIKINIKTRWIKYNVARRGGHVDCSRAFLCRCIGGSRTRARILMMLRLWPEPLLCRQLLSNSNGRAIRYGARFELVARRGKQCDGTCIKRNTAKYRIGSLCRVTRCVISTWPHKTEMMAL